MDHSKGRDISATCIVHMPKVTVDMSQGLIIIDKARLEFVVGLGKAVDGGKWSSSVPRWSW